MRSHVVLCVILSAHMRELGRAWIVLFVLLVCLRARADEPQRSNQLDPAAGLTLRPVPELRSLTERVARMLHVRTGLSVEVGASPPRDLPQAVLASQVAIVREGPEVVVVLVGPGGFVYESRVDLPAGTDASVRAIGLTIEALRDAAIAGPPPRAEGPGAVGGARVSFVYLEPEGGLFGVRQRVEPIARPTIYLRALVGFSTARNTVLLGPGVGVGLCVELSCLVLEGDLPVFPEEHPSPSDDRIVRYRPINLGMRLQIRPFRFDDFVPGLTVGVLTRFGSAWVEEDVVAHLPPESQTVTAFGLRGSLELAWVFAEPFEIVLEVGVDFVVNPARFIRMGQVVLLEDIATLWATTSIRLRP